MNAVRASGMRRYLPRRERPTQRAALGLAVVTLLLGTVVSIINNNTEVKIAGVIVIVTVLSSLVLDMRGMLTELAMVAACLTAVFSVHGLNPGQLSISGFVMIGVTGMVGVLQARRRDALGLREISAESVIGLISERLLVQSQLPSVPDGWMVEVQQRAADGAALSGDFVSNRLVVEGDSRVLHLVVVDVSGNGITAGSRALLLSGAVGGLLGAVPAADFLAAANDYLGRQQWSLGFASAVYLRLDLDSGAYSLRVAGHPPALHFRPTRIPRWRMSPATGTVLGVLPELTGAVDHDVLRPGEALILYTDGMIEDRNLDMDVGLDQLRDQVELLDERVRAGTASWTGAARVLVDRVPTDLSDDRTVVVIQRNPVPTSVAAPVPAELHSQLPEPVSPA